MSHPRLLRFAAAFSTVVLVATGLVWTTQVASAATSYQISGTIFAERTGLPVGGGDVTVTVHTSETEVVATTTTDENGAYSVSVTSDGSVRYRVHARSEMPDHGPRWYGTNYYAYGSAWSVRPGWSGDTDISGVDITVPSAGQLSGTVLYADTAEPVGAGAATVELRWCASSGVSCSDVAATAETSSDGTYRFTQLPVGRYAFLRTVVNDDDRYVGTEWGDVSVIRVTADVISVPEIELALASTIAGVVTSAGEPVADGAVRAILTRYDDGWTDTGREIDVAGGGGYAFAGLASGRYRVDFRLADAAATLVGSSDALDLGAAPYVREANFDLPPGATLGGVARDFDGDALDGFRVEVAAADPDDLGTERVVATATTDASGRWQVTGLPAGSYRVTATEPDCSSACFQARGWTRDADATGLGDWISVASSSERTDLDIRLFHGSQLSAYVQFPGQPTNVRFWYSIERRHSVTGDWSSITGNWMTTGSSQSTYMPVSLPGVYRIRVQGGYGLGELVSAPVTLEDQAHVTVEGLSLSPEWLMARSVIGSLLRYELNDGALSTYTKLSSIYNRYNRVIDIGDFDEDGYRDLVMRDPGGTLWMRPGGEDGRFGGARKISTGWNNYIQFAGVGDADGDGHPDLVAQGKSGALYLHHGNGAGGFSHRTTIGSASTWKSYHLFAGGGDVDGDGDVDLIVKSKTGRIYLFEGDGAGRFTTRTTLATGWQSITSLVGAGYFDGDGYVDVAGISERGSLLLWSGAANNTLEPVRKLAVSWQRRLLI